MNTRRRCARVRVRADEDGLARVFHTYDRFVHTHDVPDDVRRDVYVALEEIVSNIFRHAGAARHVGVTLAIDRRTLTVRIVDDGPEFDPFSAPEPDVTQALDDRPVGGLGVLLVKKLTDQHSYSRWGRFNRVVLTRSVEIKN